MADEPIGPPVVALPERMDRRLRLGPFPSGRDALKFLAYAAVGSLVALALSPPVGVGIIVLGFGVAVVRTDGRSPDQQALAYLRYRFAPGRRGSIVTPAPVSGLARRGFVALADGRYLAALRTAGTPMAYLPPSELTAKFDRFRELLRSDAGDLALAASFLSMQPGPVVPRPVGADRPDRAARDEYEGLVRTICRRRRIRRVDLLIASTEAGPAGIEQLESRAESLLGRLAALEVPARRLSGRALRDLAERVYGGEAVRRP